MILKLLHFFLNVLPLTILPLAMLKKALASIIDQFHYVQLDGAVNLPPKTQNTDSRTRSQRPGTSFS